MPLISFPDVDRPAFPGISIHVPEGWISRAAPGALIAAVKAGAPGEFATNIVVSLTRFGPDHALDTSIDALHTRVSDEGGSAWGEQSRSQTEGAEGFAAELSLHDPRVGTVVQCHRLLLIHRGPVADLVHVVGSCSAAAVKGDLIDLRTALDSLQIQA